VEQQKTSTVREMLLGALSKPPFVRVDYTVSFNLKMTHDIATGGLNECRERLYTQNQYQYKRNANTTNNHYHIQKK
jgi:hypothetical protein